MNDMILYGEDGHIQGESRLFAIFIKEHFPALHYVRTSEVFRISGYPFKIHTEYRSPSQVQARIASITPKTFRMVRTWMGINKTNILMQIAFDKL